MLPAIPTPQEFQTMKELGQMAIKSGFLPVSVNTPEKAVIIMLKGRELGIPPMHAFSSIAVVNGKPTMSAELMLSMIYRNVPGALVNFLTTNESACMIEAKRPGGKATEFSFTMDDAKRANLAGKGPWQTYPAAMLRARCISAMARAMFPDALSGVVYTPEELGAHVDDDGTVLFIENQTESTPRDVSPPQSPAKEERSAEGGDYVIQFSGKYKNATVRDAVARDGLAKLQSYAQWASEKYPTSANAKFLSVNLVRFAEQLRKAAGPLDGHGELPEDVELQLDRRMQDERGVGRMTSEYDSFGTKW